MSSRRPKPDEIPPSKNPPPWMPGLSVTKKPHENAGGSSDAIASGSGTSGSSMGNQQGTDQALEDLPIHSLKLIQDRAAETINQNARLRQIQMAALTKTMDTCKKRASSTSDILFQRAALTSTEVSVLLERTQLDLQQDGLMILDDLKEEHDAAAAEFNKLRLTITSEEKARQFEEACDKYKTDTNESSPDEELAKMAANSIYIPKLPCKLLDKWVEEWKCVNQKFLEIIMAQLVPREEWPNVEIGVWTWLAGETRPPGKIRCQEMLQTYLLPFLEMEGNKKAIETFGLLEIRYPGAWNQLITAINNKKHGTFIIHHKKAPGIQSKHYPYLYAGIIQCLYVWKSLGRLPLIHVRDGSMTASATEDVQELNIGRIKQAVWECVKSNVLEELAKYDEQPEISNGVLSFGVDQGVAPTANVSGIQGPVQIEAAVTIQPATEPVTAASQATSSTAQSLSLNPARESDSSSDPKESTSMVNTRKRGKFATATKGDGPGKTAGVPEKVKRYAATAAKVQAPRSLKSALRKAATDDGQ